VKMPGNRDRKRSAIVSTTPQVHVPQFLEASFLAVENLRSTSPMGARIHLFGSAFRE
jgi:hypothetical protein